ncbi:MAG: outer membrane beta-barrel protein [Casimicrobiaceae bacterium]
MLFQSSAWAQGFYGGFSVRPKNLNPGVALIEPDSLSWMKPTGDEPSEQARIYGGYRLQSDLGIEASLTHSQRLGLRFDPKSFGFTAGDPTSRAWNLDVYTSLALQPKFAVYGRVGYEQPNGSPQLSASLFVAPPKPALGLNYGIGLRYDLNTAMGVRFEWARPYRSSATANASASSVADPGRSNDAADQVSVGLQFRF